MVSPKPSNGEKETVGATGAGGQKRVDKEGGHNMTTPVSTTTSYISDDDSDANIAACPQCDQHGWVGTYCLRCEDQGMTHSVPIGRQPKNERQRGWRTRMTTRLRRLARVGKAGSELPQIGQPCLILRGVEGKDLGQQAIITTQTKARVEVSFRAQSGRQMTKLKHPSSLILLEDGLEVVQDERGFVWIKREREQE
jgi:hypothetical protein